MGFLTTYASHAILDFIAGNVPIAVPLNFYIALSKTELGEDGSGLIEPSGGGYTRLQIPNNKISFSEASNKIVTIIKDFAFPESEDDWGEIAHFVIFDDKNNPWFYGELQNGFDVQIDSSVILDPNTNSFIFDICGGSTTDMNITTYWANQILNHFFGNSPTLILPENYYMGVSSTVIDESGEGISQPTNAIEYQRLEIPNDKTSFTVASDRSVAIAKEFRFHMANVNWKNMTHHFISDSLTGGNMLWSGRLARNRNVQINTTLSIRPNGFSGL